MSNKEHDPTIGIIAQQPENSKYKPLTINVPFEIETSELEGMDCPSWIANVMTAMLREWSNIARGKEAARVLADSPLVCVRCRQYRASHCSLCQEQVCFWCHHPDKDHHGGEVRRGETKTYILIDPETGDLVPHQAPGGDKDNSYYIHESLPGPCLTCGYKGHINRLLYRDPHHAPPAMKGIAFKAVCYACGAGNGNREPVHETHTETQTPALANIPGEG